jgi:hypothetical protein
MIRKGPRRIIAKIPKLQIKERTPIYFKEKLIRITSDHSAETLKARKA